MLYSTTYISVEICKRLGLKLSATSGQVMSHHFEHGRRSPCMSIDLDRGVWHCFSCGQGGTLRSLYFDKTGSGIYKDLGIKKDEVTFEPYVEVDVNFDDVPESNFEFVGKTVPAESCHQGKKFLDSRGFTREESKKFSMKFVISGITRSKDDPENKDYHINFKDRVIIPIYEAGRMISLEGRDTVGEKKWREKMIELGKDPDEMTYKKVLYPKLSSVNTLYGLSSLDRSKRLYVVEGLMDLISLRTHPEFRNSTALFHATPGRRQLYLLDKFEEVCVIPDRDEAGLNTLKKLMGEDSIRRKLRVLPTPEGCKDVNDILQGKNPNVKTVSGAVEKGWLTKIVDPSDVPLETLVNF